jgi:thiol-disulfide isomerase/thioredoxin
MDRLYAVTILLLSFCLVAGACKGNDGDEAEAQSPRKSRVNAVQAKDEPAQPPGAFCDVYRTSDEAVEFSWPELDSQPPGPSGTGWRWVNVWATWCKPCIEEMPMLVDWRKKLEPVDDLVLVSADESRDLVVEFRKKHPATPESLLLQDVQALPGWLAELGLDAGGSLPIQILVDGDNKVRCIRAGGITENNFDVVEAMVSGETG